MGNTSVTSCFVDSTSCDLFYAPPLYFQNAAAAKGCSWCQKQFSLFAVRKNCYDCGQVFCEECTQYTKPLAHRGFDRPVCVCFLCFNKSPTYAMKRKGSFQQHIVSYDPGACYSGNNSFANNNSINNTITPPVKNLSMVSSSNPKGVVAEAPGSSNNSQCSGGAPHRADPSATTPSIPMKVLVFGSSQRNRHMLWLAAKSISPTYGGAILVDAPGSTSVTTLARPLVMERPFGKCKVTVTVADGMLGRDLVAYVTGVTGVLVVVDANDVESMSYALTQLETLRPHLHSPSGEAIGFVAVYCVIFNSRGQGKAEALRGIEAITREHRGVVHCMAAQEENDEDVGAEVRSQFQKLVFASWQSCYGMSWHGSIHPLLSGTEQRRIGAIVFALTVKSKQQSTTHHEGVEEEDAADSVIRRTWIRGVLQYITMPWIDPTVLIMA